MDRARRGISGALQSATRSSGAEFPDKGPALGAGSPQAALTARSCAVSACEPGQVRKEAALSGSRHVMQASLARAKRSGYDRESVSRMGARSIFPLVATSSRTSVRESPTPDKVPVMGKAALLALPLAALLLAAGVANAQRKPTLKEHAQIAT